MGAGFSASPRGCHCKRLSLKKLQFVCVVDDAGHRRSIVRKNSVNSHCPHRVTVSSFFGFLGVQKKCFSLQVRQSVIVFVARCKSPT